MFFVLLVAISLSIDALGIGLSYGVRNIVTPFFTKCILFLETMFFMGLFLWIGNHMTFFFSAKTANNIGIVLLPQNYYRIPVLVTKTILLILMQKKDFLWAFCFLLILWEQALEQVL